MARDITDARIRAPGHPGPRRPRLPKAGARLLASRAMSSPRYPLLAAALTLALWTATAFAAGALEGQSVQVEAGWLTGPPWGRGVGEGGYGSITLGYEADGPLAGGLVLGAARVREPLLANGTRGHQRPWHVGLRARWTPRRWAVRPWARAGLGYGDFGDSHGPVLEGGAGIESRPLGRLVVGAGVSLLAVSPRLGLDLWSGGGGGSSPGFAATTAFVRWVPLPRAGR